MANVFIVEYVGLGIKTVHVTHENETSEQLLARLSVDKPWATLKVEQVWSGVFSVSHDESRYSKELEVMRSDHSK